MVHVISSHSLFALSSCNPPKFTLGSNPFLMHVQCFVLFCFLHLPVSQKVRDYSEELRCVLCDGVQAEKKAKQVEEKEADSGRHTFRKRKQNGRDDPRQEVMCTPRACPCSRHPLRIHAMLHLPSLVHASTGTTLHFALVCEFSLV